MLRQAINASSYDLLEIGRQGPSTKLKNWPRKPKKLEEFTDAGKRCHERFRLQIEKRLPPPKKEDCLSVLLDPLTKGYAEKALLGKQLFDETHQLLKEKHRASYKAFHGPSEGNAKEKEPSISEGEEELAEPQPSGSEAGSDDEEDDESLDMVCVIGSPPRSKVDGTEALNRKADAELERWMEEKVIFDDYKFENAKPVPREAGQSISFYNLMQRFDTLRYFREKGAEDFPTITLLARIHFSRMTTAAFQERVFSTAKNAQEKNQGRMKFDHLEKRTLLSHNKELIRKKVI